jgi:hypothetical protein
MNMDTSPGGSICDGAKEEDLHKTRLKSLRGRLKSASTTTVIEDTTEEQQPPPIIRAPTDNTKSGK